MIRLYPANKLVGYDDSDFFYRYVGETPTHFLVVICSTKTKKVVNSTLHAVKRTEYTLKEEKGGEDEGETLFDGRIIADHI